MPPSANHSPANGTSSKGWIAVDLDGTLAHYDVRHGINIIGRAIAPTVQRIKHWLAAGIEVRVFTARASDPLLVAPVQAWLVDNGLPPLAVTNRRDMDLLQLWDDRAVQIECNTGVVLTPKQYTTFHHAGWIGVELDGTLAYYHPDQKEGGIGLPVEKMLARIQDCLKMDIDMRLFTGRATDPAMIPVMESWLEKHQLGKMKITCEKDFMLSQFWDDRAIHVISNSGDIAPAQEINIPDKKLFII